MGNSVSHGNCMEWEEDGVVETYKRYQTAISPYLFVMCMERLGHIVHEEVVSERWKHVQASQNGPKLSHLVFADDLISFIS